MTDEEWREYYAARERRRSAPMPMPAATVVNLARERARREAAKRAAADPCELSISFDQTQAARQPTAEPEQQRPKETSPDASDDDL